MSEFKKIHNLVSQAIGHRVGDGQFPKIYAEIARNGFDNIMRDRLLTVLIAWCEQHEKDCNLIKGSAIVDKEAKHDKRNVHNSSDSSTTGSSQ